MRLLICVGIAVLACTSIAHADDGSTGSIASAATTTTSPSASPAPTIGSHPEWGVFTSGALTVGVAFTISIVFAGLGDYYGYSGFLGIPLAGGFVYASFDELDSRARWRGALLSASQALGLVVWIIGMLIDVPDAQSGSTQLAPGPGDMGLSVTIST